MKKHFIIATYDGIGTHYSGVGTIAKNLIDALLELLGEVNLKVSVAYINVDKNSNVFNERCFEKAVELTSKTGGSMIPLWNGTRGQTEWDMWRSFNEWNYTCISLVTALNLMLDPNEENFILLNDTPFLFFAKYKNLINDKSIRCFYFPLSTGKNHAFGNQDWRNNRIRAERECFDLISKDGASKVIALGKKFAERMSDDYGLSFGNSDFLQNGLFFKRYDEYLDKKCTYQDLKKFGIRIGSDSKLIFSWGRCSIAKGFKELASAWAKIVEQLPDHYLVLQMPNNSGEADYFSEVKDILSGAPRSVVLDDFNPDIWKTVLRTENIDIVCIPSIMDPFPHTSIEAKLFSSGMGYVTVISEVDGAVDAFGRDEAIYVDPQNADLFAQKLVDAALMDSEARQRMIDANRGSVEGFNFQKSLKEFLIENVL